MGGDGGGLLLSSAYLAPVHYYTKLYSGALAQQHSGGSEGRIVEEQADHYVKQTYRNRCVIAGDDGPVALTIPVSAPEHLADGSVPAGISKTPMHSVLISDHGNWRHQHWQAIVSAYQSSPYFEYYADEFSAVFHQPLTTADGLPLRLVDFNASLRDFILDALGLCPTIEVNTGRYIDGASVPAGTDFRETIRPKLPYSADSTFRPAPYYQVFAQRHGFLPNMSIIDLLFNMGPESRIVLRNSIC